jgi:hypothetical protein
MKKTTKIRLEKRFDLAVLKLLAKPPIWYGKSAIDKFNASQG